MRHPDIGPWRKGRRQTDDIRFGGKPPYHGGNGEGRNKPVHCHQCYRCRRQSSFHAVDIPKGHYAVVHGLVPGHHRRQEPHGCDDTPKQPRLDDNAMYHYKGRSGQRSSKSLFGRQGLEIQYHRPRHGLLLCGADCVKGVLKAIACNKQLKSCMTVSWRFG